jgi:hypothetical protein
MKKSLLFAIILGGTIALTSCGKDEECVCDDGTTYTESDVPSGTTLDEVCTVARVGDSSCSMN